MLDEVTEFRITVESLPAPKVTWIKDGAVLGNVAAEISTSLVKTGETRWAFHVPNSTECCGVIRVESTMSHVSSLKHLCRVFSYQSVLTLIRARSEDSGNYTIKAQTGDLTTSHSFYLQVKGETYFFTCGLTLIFVCLRSFACVGFCLCSLAVCLSWCISTSSIITLLRIFVYVFLGVNWRIFFWTLCSYMQAAFSRIGYCTKRVWSKIK